VWEKFSKGGEATVNFTGGKDRLDGDQKEGKEENQGRRAYLMVRVR
jgi:hypothetical protein